MKITKAGAGVAAMVAALTVQTLAGGRASASPVPFTDGNSNGALALCGRNDQPETSGSLLDRPFVWKAISTAPTPAHYTRAYLAVFQPIQNVDPADWTGYPLTAATIFSNPAHPVAQATNLDAPLLEPDRQMPPLWDGLYELRMFFTGPDEPAYNSTYPMAVVRVTGNNWQLVDGGGVACSAGRGVSVVSFDASRQALSTPQTVSIGPKDAGAPSPTGSKTSAFPSSTTRPRSTTTKPSASTTLPAGKPAAVAGGPTHSNTSHTSSDHSGLLIGLLTGAAVIVAGAAAAVLRRRLRAA